MGCKTCGGGNNYSLANTEKQAQVVQTKKEQELPLVAEASEDPKKKVRLRYYGGAYKRSTGGGCSACGGGRGGYSLTTTETIMFPSEDAPTGIYRQVVSVGHEYYVTEKQAEYMLGLTYINRGGQVVHKFKRID